MAKKSIMARNDKRKKLVDGAKVTYKKLKEMIRTGSEDVELAVDKLNKRKRDKSSVRLCNRCRSCGRGHGVLRKFGLCRICVREAAMRGDIPGLKKESW